MNKKYDVIILGAGINGVAIAKILSLAGKKVLVIEKSHIAAGASSHSSKLIHGGLRYLENFEFSLVKESLQDQTYLLNMYPNLVKLHPFYLPIYSPSKRPIWMIRLGLWLYGFFAQHGKKPRLISKDKFLKQFQAIKAEHLKAVFTYYDGQTNDNALTHQIAKEAKSAGALFKEHTHITNITCRMDDILIHIKEQTISAPILINATGAWVDEVNEKFHLPSSFHIEKLSGIHIVIGRKLVPEPLILETLSQRIFFILPQVDTTIIGTTERSEQGRVDDISINDEDINYLLQASNTYLKIPLTHKDIIDTYIGTRPIIKSNKDFTHMSREYKLDFHQVNKCKILHIYGGKLTTFHSLSKKVLKFLAL